jgi:hypothetical protein
MMFIWFLRYKRDVASIRRMPPEELPSGGCRQWISGCGECGGGGGDARGVADMADMANMAKRMDTMKPMDAMRRIDKDDSG